jgi:hypothetical protein
MQRNLKRIGAWFAAIGAEAMNLWAHRLAPWLLGHGVRKELQDLCQETTPGKIRAALRACLRSTDRVMRESW